jgi:hypothetical protein
MFYTSISKHTKKLDKPNIYEGGRLTCARAVNRALTAAYRSSGEGNC